MPHRADIVNELRNLKSGGWVQSPEIARRMESAAVEIEHLRIEIERLKSVIAMWELCATQTRDYYGGVFVPEERA